MVTTVCPGWLESLCTHFLEVHVPWNLCREGGGWMILIVLLMSVVGLV